MNTTGAFHALDNFEAFEKVCNCCFYGCLKSNSSSSGTGCKWSVSVSMLGGGPAESRNRPLNHAKKRYFRVEHEIYYICSMDILNLKL